MLLKEIKKGEDAPIFQCLFFAGRTLRPLVRLTRGDRPSSLNSAVLSGSSLVPQLAAPRCAAALLLLSSPRPSVLPLSFPRRRRDHSLLLPCSRPPCAIIASSTSRSFPGGSAPYRSVQHSSQGRIFFELDGPDVLEQEKGGRAIVRQLFRQLLSMSPSETIHGYSLTIR